MTTEQERVQELAVPFADEISALVSGSFECAPELEIVAVADRIRLAPVGQEHKLGGVPLKIDGETLAWLRFEFLCRLDSSSSHLAIHKSSVWVVAEVDSTPIFRFDYVRDADWVPHSHIQVHGQRGALSHLLSRSGHKKPHEMAALHLPTGGARFRPNLEDVIQFLVADCKFDARDSWRSAVEEARQRARRTQLRAAVRSMAAEAAGELRVLGYSVEPPEGGDPPMNQNALTAW